MLAGVKRNICQQPLSTARKTSRTNFTSEGRLDVVAEFHILFAPLARVGKFQIWGRRGGAEPPGIDDLLDGAPRPADAVLHQLLDLTTGAVDIVAR